MHVHALEWRVLPLCAQLYWVLSNMHGHAAGSILYFYERLPFFKMSFLVLFLLKVVER